jgi:hypothetical protein
MSSARRLEGFKQASYHVCAQNADVRCSAGVKINLHEAFMKPPWQERIPSSGRMPVQSALCLQMSNAMQLVFTPVVLQSLFDCSSNCMAQLPPRHAAHAKVHASCKVSWSSDDSSAMYQGANHTYVIMH